MRLYEHLAKNSPYLKDNKKAVNALWQSLRNSPSDYLHWQT